MPLNLKITWGAGGSSVRMMGLSDELNLGDFKKLIANKSEIDPSRMQLKAGFPPKNVLGSETDLVVQLGITSGSAVTVLERDVTPPAQATSQPRPSAPTPTSTASARPNPPKPVPPPVTPPTHNALSNETVKMLVDMGFPREYAKRALEVAGGDINIALEICMGGDPSAFMAEDAGAATAAAASAPAAPATIMVRRIVDADNSCLFNSVGYVLRRKRKVGSELRRMITDAVRGNPYVYNEGILGKQPEDYCAWIADSKSWGGEIELSILSKKLSVMITVVDIQTNNAYSYGEADGYDRRVFVIYDGIHYDALAEAVSASAPEVDDVTTFHPEDTEKLRMAKEVAADLKSRNQFTNMGNADLKCMVCLKLFEGEKGALEHARATGHQNFGQV